jgi:hypothetical protein
MSVVMIPAALPMPEIAVEAMEEVGKQNAKT